MDAKEMMLKRLNELYDKLNDLTVGTQEYDKVLTQYLNLYRVYEEAEKNENKRAENALKEKELDNELKIELRKNWFEVLKVVISIFGSVMGIFIYRKIFDKTGDPFFKDIGRSILGLIRKA
jgi:hypothetical protein